MMSVFIFVVTAITWLAIGCGLMYVAVDSLLDASLAALSCASFFVGISFIIAVIKAVKDGNRESDS